MQGLIKNKPFINFGAQFNQQKQEELMGEARKATQKSDCNRAQTGAVVTSPDGEVIGVGWNTIPDEFITCGTKAGNECPRINFNIPSGESYDKSCLAIHAEARAIADAGLRTIQAVSKEKGSTLFLAGHTFLCNGCKSMVSLAKGIKDIYVQHKQGDPIKHYSREELMKELESSHKENLLKLEDSYKTPLKKTSCGATSCTNCGCCK